MADRHRGAGRAKKAPRRLWTCRFACRKAWTMRERCPHAKRRTSLTLRVNVRVQTGSVSFYDVHRRQTTRTLAPQCPLTDALAGKEVEWWRDLIAANIPPGILAGQRAYSWRDWNKG